MDRTHPLSIAAGLSTRAAHKLQSVQQFTVFAILARRTSAVAVPNAPRGHETIVALTYEGRSEMGRPAAVEILLGEL